MRYTNTEIKRERLGRMCNRQRERDGEERERFTSKSTGKERKTIEAGWAV